MVIFNSYVTNYQRVDCYQFFVVIFGLYWYHLPSGYVT